MARVVIVAVESCSSKVMADADVVNMSTWNAEKGSIVDVKRNMRPPLREKRDWPRDEDQNS